jgi:hypothetical protein
VGLVAIQKDNLTLGDIVAFSAGDDGATAMFDVDAQETVKRIARQAITRLVSKVPNNGWV